MHLNINKIKLGDVKSMKKLLALSLCLVLVFSMTGCSAIRAVKDIKDAVNQGGSVSESPSVSTPDVTPSVKEEQPKEETPAPTSSIEEEMQGIVNALLKANMDAEGLLDLVGIFNTDYEYVEHIKYYDDALLCKAMVKDSTFGNISKANSLTVQGVETLSRGVYAVELKNDLGSDFQLRVIKVDDSYLVDISRLFVSAAIKVTDGVEPYLNGVSLSKEHFEKMGTYGDRVYVIPYLLGHIENTMQYETGYSESVNRGFIADKTISVEDAVDLRYYLTTVDLTPILSKTAELWTSLHAVAKEKDSTGVSALLTDDSPLQVSTIVDGHQVTRLKLAVKQFEQRPESKCYMISKTRMALNLRSVFIGEYSFGTYTPSEFNWVVIDIQEDGSYKIYDASTNVWIDGEINAYSDD